jgi:hypothetical protein
MICTKHRVTNNLLYTTRRPTQRWDYLNDSMRRKLSTDKTAVNVVSSRRGKSPRLVAAAATAMTVVVGMSYYVRQFRRRKLQELDYVTSSSLPQQRNLNHLMETMERMGQMGQRGKKSVKDELGTIRKWHSDHGYKGGLVLRELTQPLFVHEGSGNIMENLEDFALDPMRLARRECYYLYYEITGTGEIKQQIFCRGTTLAIDVLTCFSFWMVYDEDLGCRVHIGFRNQADRILQDIEPLLTPSDDKRATIEVSGHSLGGCVAYILAAKLQERGYRVVRVTSVGAPRFCASASAASRIESLLPTDNLRIENDTDFVTFLPPFAHHVLGNKLYLIDETPGKMAYIRSTNPILKWADSVFANFRVWELVLARGHPHRVPYYLSHMKQTLEKHND